MKIKILAIKNYDEYQEKYQAYVDDPKIFQKPVPEYVETFTNFKKDRIVQYMIVPAEATTINKDIIEITKVDSQNNEEEVRAIYSKELEERLDQIIGE